MRRSITNNFMSRIQASNTPQLFDRCEMKAKNPSWLWETLFRNPKTKMLGVYKNDVAMSVVYPPPSPTGSGDDETGGVKKEKKRRAKATGLAPVPLFPRIHLNNTEENEKKIGTAETAKDCELLQQVFLLGVDTRTETPYFVRHLEEFEVEDAKIHLGESIKMINLRNIVSSLSGDEASLIAQGKSLVEWHHSAQFCGFCGTKTMAVDGGRSRTCPNCEKPNYPRTNPVAIMCVLSPDGTKCLLGQTAARHIGNMYSCLAGFIDQGEALENAVCRETYEEAGVLLEPRSLRYHSSQPWPYPSQLMLGMIGVATSEEINFDPEEMHDVQWFSRELVAKALQNDSDDLQVPPPIAIANIMMQSWVDGEQDDLIAEMKEWRAKNSPSKI